MDVLIRSACPRSLQQIHVAESLVGLPVFQRCQYIVAQPPQFLNDTQRNVLVGVEQN